MAAPSFFRATPDGVELLVRFTPKSSRDTVEGIGETADGRRHLKARVRAVPANGKANRALEKLLANWLDVAPRDVTLVTGTTSR